MEMVVLGMLFTVSLSAQFGKHVYVQDPRNWVAAQKHCRAHYIDLSPITSSWEEERLRNATKGLVKMFWIGLHRHVKEWKWSGGGHATYIPWDAEEPDNKLDEIFGSICWQGCQWNGWHNIPFSELPFFCFNLIMMENRMTWEEAIRHCSMTHTTLTSLASETEQLLALSKIRRDHITERVWIGLRYLADRWLWVDGSPMEYEAWPQGGEQDHQCPIWKRCGALTKGGLWENWDCQDSLNFICF